MDKLKLANLAWSDVFEELPVRIQNSTLAKAMLAHIEPATAAQQPDFKDLQLGPGPMLLKSLDFMNEFLDEVVAEQQKASMPCLSLPKLDDELSRCTESFSAQRAGVILSQKFSEATSPASAMAAEEAPRKRPKKVSHSFGTSLYTAASLLGTRGR